ncbi:uncharacterized protein LOC131950080 [Physella acuta]|uniref:uncharacterized protein LOC131950080 n=1 Tax=Physella acuta TaxID=109671 RepID=UPI0027DD0AB2|nr:uncharacterized protein LOC131950080 [Physella acuta]XP_059168104.1 uncharacterized protein LOC131950080 [Physella acuta]
MAKNASSHSTRGLSKKTEGGKKKKKAHPLEMLLGDVLKKSSGDSISPVALAVDEGKEGIIGLYFAANWCPPCKMFTPQLNLLYDEVKRAGKQFEVVFVSFDYNELSFKQYFSKMPWLAIDFNDSEKREAVAAEFGIRGIPVLLFIDAATFKPITLNGREIVSLDPRGEKFPWKFPVSKMSESASKAANAVPMDRASSTSSSSGTPGSDTDATLRLMSPKTGPKPSDSKQDDVKKEPGTANVSPVGGKPLESKKRQSVMPDSNKVDSNKGSAQTSKVALN